MHLCLDVNPAYLPSHILTALGLPEHRLLPCGDLILPRQTHDLWPGDHQAVVGQTLLGPFLSFAHAVQPVSKITRRIAECPHFAQERRRTRFALFCESADELLRYLPNRQAAIRSRRRAAATRGPERECLSESKLV